MMKNFLQKGDTLTEVMFATAVAALVIVLSVSAMNRSLAQTEMAVETTLVRQSIDAEAELLRYARDQYKDDPTGAGGATWRGVIAQAEANTDGKASTFGTCYDNSATGGLPADSFFVTDTDLNNPTIKKVSDVGATNFPPDTFANIGQGIWIEAVKSPSSVSIPYIDLHIRACWEPPFSGPKSTLGTIVRLYYSTV